MIPLWRLRSRWRQHGDTNYRAQKLIFKGGQTLVACRRLFVGADNQVANDIFVEAEKAIDLTRTFGAHLKPL